MKNIGFEFYYRFRTDTNVVHIDLPDDAKITEVEWTQVGIVWNP